MTRHQSLYIELYMYLACSRIIKESGCRYTGSTHFLRLSCKNDEMFGVQFELQRQLKTVQTLHFYIPTLHDRMFSFL